MILPKELTTVTPLSKTVALVLFIGLPILGFFLGMRYREVQNQTPSQLITQEITLTPSQAPTQNDNQYACNDDSDCQLVINGGWSICNYSGACQPIDYSLDKWIAVNGDWYNQTLNKNCPEFDKMGAPGCFPRPININYESRCINHVCNKIITP